MSNCRNHQTTFLENHSKKSGLLVSSITHTSFIDIVSYYKGNRSSCCLHSQFGVVTRIFSFQARIIVRQTMRNVNLSHLPTPPCLVTSIITLLFTIHLQDRLVSGYTLSYPLTYHTYDKYDHHGTGHTQ